MRILPEFGGQSKLDDKDYVIGAPELLAEIAYSTRAIDMNQKRADYERAGVREYLVVCIEERKLHWFNFPAGQEIRPSRKGVSRSVVFPGLWVHNKALLAQDSPRLIEVIQQGIASREHAVFVRRLEAQRRRRS
jgi:hypothetical protein